MKVTFIYAYEEGEEWSTPMALIKEFQLRGWKTEIVSIGSNRTGHYHDMKLQRWIELKPDSDVVIFMDWGRFDSPFLNKELVPNAFWIQESGDDPQNWERNSPKANRFHYTITPDYDSYLKYKSLGVNVEWITHFADTAIQYPMNLEPEYVAVTTRGFGNSQFLDYLTNWAEGGVGNKNGMEGIEHTKFLNKGLMIVQNSRWGEITRRIFEGMACGKMVLTDRLNESKKLHELFKEGEEIVFYDDMRDCIEKMNYYNENEVERERIAFNGYEKVINNFSQKNVVDKLIKQYERSINSSLQ